MRNQYAGHCMHCRNFIPKGEGYVQRVHGQFKLRCMSCVVELKKTPLSDAQAAFVRKVCSCGKGYSSAIDGKCGHCRNKEERFAHRLMTEMGS